MSYVWHYKFIAAIDDDCDETEKIDIFIRI